MKSFSVIGCEHSLFSYLVDKLAL
jgi:hypothetical protein